MSAQAFGSTGYPWQIVTSPNQGTAVLNNLGGVACPATNLCFAAGYYANSGGYDQPLLMEYNGISWSLQTAPTVSTTETVYLVTIGCSSTTLCVAGGEYKDSSGIYQTFAEAWNGSAWSDATLPASQGTSNNYIEGSTGCIPGGSCMIFGMYYNGTVYLAMEDTWNGTSWSSTSMPDEGSYTNYLYGGGACYSSSFCMAVGYYYANSAGTVVDALAETWNGTAWSVALPVVYGTSYNLFYGVSCASATMCMAVGEYYTGSVYQPLSETWNGSTWSDSVLPVSASSTGSWLLAVSCITTTACEGVGQYKDSGGVLQGLSETWNGTAWSDSPLPPDAGSAVENYLSGIYCFSTERCWAAGYYGSTDQTLIMTTLMTSGTVLTSSANPANVVTFTAVVSGGSGNPTPTGTVTFNNTTSSSVLCNAVSVAQGSLPSYEAEATCSVTLPTTGGPFSIDAAYTGDGNYLSSTSNTISQSTNACSGGTLTLSAPATITIPGPTLTGLNQSVSSSVALDPSDMTGSGAGWNITATSTTFTDAGGATLPTTATTFTSSSAVAGSGNCNLPTNSIAYPLQLPAASTAPTAVIIYNAANSTGEGPSVVTMDFTTAIPSSTYAQTYSSTWTFTLVSGP